MSTQGVAITLHGCGVGSREPRRSFWGTSPGLFSSSPCLASSSISCLSSAFGPCVWSPGAADDAEMLLVCGRLCSRSLAGLCTTAADRRSGQRHCSEREVPPTFSGGEGHAASPRRNRPSSEAHSGHCGPWARFVTATRHGFAKRTRANYQARLPASNLSNLASPGTGRGTLPSRPDESLGPRLDFPFWASPWSPQRGSNDPTLPRPCFGAAVARELCCRPDATSRHPPFPASPG